MSTSDQTRKKKSIPKAAAALLLARDRFEAAEDALADAAGLADPCNAVRLANLARNTALVAESLSRIVFDLCRVHNGVSR